MEKKKVLLVDDHELVRVGLGMVIDEEDRFEMAACVKDSAEAMEAMKKYKPNIALVDIRLKGESGIDICKEITEHYPDTKVLMLTSFGDDDLILKSIKAGASGYILKQVSNDEILKGLHQVADGGYLFDSETTGKVINMMRNMSEDKRVKQLKEKLNENEYKILSLIGKGKTNGEIAETLNLSINIVKNSVSSLLRKLEFGNRSEAAIFAAKNDIEKE